MDTNISIKKKGKEWIATRNKVKGYGKTKKIATADLEETERFLKITEIARTVFSPKVFTSEDETYLARERNLRTFDGKLS
jgi:Asp-tRNA(Asn)/Glu-tRNA(Gln) amidotransferase B subunit